MLVSWYLPPRGFSLWPCVALLIIFVPITVWHERSWRRTIAEYARLRREAGASDAEWPSASLRVLMAVQPWLLLTAAGLLTAAILVAALALAAWPRRLPGFDMAVNYFDLPYLWTMLIAGAAGVITAVAIALDAARSPWARVADRVRRAIHTRPETRERLFAEALAADPGIPLALLWTSDRAGG